MRTPIRPLPGTVESWIRRARWLRWADATVAWALLTALGALLLPRAAPTSVAVVAAIATLALAAIGPLRPVWRPLSSIVALVVSHPVRPGDRAWLVGSGQARLVVVTGRRGLRVVIAARGPTEGITVLRTSVLLVPDDAVVRAAP